jgi:hypothetical protein
LQRAIVAEHKAEEATDAQEVLSQLSPELNAYANAVVHPFGDEGLGATRPDNWNTISLPVTDRLTMDIDPSIFFNANTALDTLEAIQITLVPRCLAAGWTRSTASDQMLVPLISCDAELEYIEGEWVPRQQYYLLVSAIGTVNGELNQYAYWSTDNTMRSSEENSAGAANAVAFSRFSKYADNADGGRIIGMGLKIWSEAAPINTGGTAYGGWITIADLFGEYRKAATDAASVTDLMFKRKHFKGAAGVTVRYSPTQEPDQLNYVVPFLDTIALNGTDWNEQVDIEIGADWAQQDQCNPGTYVPCALWKFDSTDQSSSYSIRVEARVHIHARPKGNCPFMTVKPTYDPLIDYLDNILANPQLFPIVVEGASFKSFMRHLRQVIGRGIGAVQSAAPHIARFLDMANKYAPRAL